MKNVVVYLRDFSRKKAKLIVFLIAITLWSTEAIPAIINGEKDFWHAKDLGGGSFFQEPDKNKNVTYSKIEEKASGILHDFTIIDENAKKFEDYEYVQAKNMSENSREIPNVVTPKSPLGEVIDFFGLNALFNTILETRSYYVLTRVYNESNGSWSENWVTPLSVIPRPEIRFIDIDFPGGLENELLRTPVDADGDSDIDYYVLITLERSWGMDGIRPYLEYVEAKIEFDNVAWDKNISITILRPIRFDNKEYLWSLTHNFSKLPDKYIFRASMNEVKFTTALDILEQIINNRTASLQFSTLKGPLLVEVNMSEQISNLSFSLGYCRKENDKLIDASIFGIEFSRPYLSNYITIDVTPDFSSQVRYLKLLNFKGLGSTGRYESKPNVKLHYYYETICKDGFTTNSTSNKTYMRTYLNPLPTELKISLLNISKNKEPMTEFSFFSSEEINEIQIEDFFIVSNKIEREGNFRIGKIPKEFSLIINYDARLESSEIEFFQPPAFNNSLIPRVVNFDSIMQYIASIFYNIGIKLREIPYKILYAPTRDLYFQLNASKPIGDIDIYILEGTRKYISVNNSEQITFYKDKFGISANIHLSSLSNSTLRLGTEKKIDLVFENNSLSGKLCILSISENKTKQDSENNIENTNEIDLELLSFAPVPEHINLTMNLSHISYNSSCKLSNLTFLSLGENYFEITLYEVPESFKIIQMQGETSIKCNSEIGLADISFYSSYHSNCTLKKLPEQHILIYRTSTNLSKPYNKPYNKANEEYASIRLYNLSNFSIITSKENEKNELKLHLDSFSNKELRMVIQNDTLNLAEHLFASIYLSTFPNSIDFTFTAKEDTDNFALSNSFYSRKINTTVSGLADIATILSSISSIGSILLSNLMNISAYMCDNLGLGNSISFSYSLDNSTTMHVYGIIDKGTLDLDAKWQHGIFLAALKSNFQLRLFLENLPAKGEIEFKNENEEFAFLLNLGSYAPCYEYIAATIKGLKSGDAHIHIGLAKNAKFDYLILNLSVKLSDTENGLSASGFAKLSSSPPCMFTNMSGDISRQSKISMNSRTYIKFTFSNIPSALDTSFLIVSGKKIDILYSSSSTINLLYLSILQERIRINDNTLHTKNNYANITLRDLPPSLTFHMNMRGNIGNIDLLSPMASFPDIFLSTNANTLDIYADIDGKISGLNGKYRICAENITDISCKLSDRYIIKSNGSDFISLLIENAISNIAFGLGDVEKITFYAENLKSANILIATSLLFYPTVNIDGLDANCFFVSIKANILGKIPLYAVILTTNPISSTLNYAQFTNGNGMLLIAFVPSAIITMPILIPITIFSWLGYHRYIKFKKSKEQNAKEDRNDEKDSCKKIPKV